MSQRIYPNVNFIEKYHGNWPSFMLTMHILPEILRSSLSAYKSTSTAATGNSSQQLYCLCQQVEYGKMIMHDSPSYDFIMDVWIFNEHIKVVQIVKVIVCLLAM